MPKTLDELEEWARLLRKENHPLAETMEEIAEGWRDTLHMLEEVALHIRRGQDISEWYSEVVDTIEKAKGD